MRCGECRKFVSFDEQDPEVEDLTIDEEGQITAEVRIVNACAECGTELKSFTFSTEADVESQCEGHTGSTIPEPEGEDEEAEEEEHELQIEESYCERTSRSEGKGRGTKTFYGFKLEANVTCSCGKLGETKKVMKEGKEVEEFQEGVAVEIADDVQASDMDEEC
jgi:hypothetical protein